MTNPPHPTISLSLTVRSNQDPHIIKDLIPHLDEIIAVLVSPDTDAEKNWRQALESLEIPHRIFKISPDTHPHLYAADVPETFKAGDPLYDEVYPDLFDGLPFIADWATVRNLGWSNCSMEWRLALSDTDVVTNPEQLPSICQNLDDHQQDIGHVLHRRGQSTYFPARLARRDSGVKFEGISRERLVGGSRPSGLWLATPQDNLTTYSQQSSSRIEDWHATRALYAECRRSGWVVPPDELLHLARSCRITMPQLASCLLDLYLQTSPDSERRSWAQALTGEIYEASGKIEEAIRWYEASKFSHPGWKSALRLCQANFKKSLCEACVNAYSSANTSLPHVHDDGEQNPPSSLILVASALHQLGRVDEAQQIGSSLAEIFPGRKSVMEFCRSLGC